MVVQSHIIQRNEAVRQLLAEHGATVRSDNKQMSASVYSEPAGLGRVSMYHESDSSDEFHDPQIEEDLATALMLNQEMEGLRVYRTLRSSPSSGLLSALDKADECRVRHKSCQC